MVISRQYKVKRYRKGEEIMTMEIILASPEMERKTLVNFLVKYDYDVSIIYVFSQSSSKSRGIGMDDLANANVFLLVEPLGRAAVVGKRFEARRKTAYLAWEGVKYELAEYLEAGNGPYKATEALKTFLKGKCIVVEEKEGSISALSYYEPTFDGIVSAFKSVGVDDIYGVLGTTA